MELMNFNLFVFNNFIIQNAIFCIGQGQQFKFKKPQEIIEIEPKQGKLLNDVPFTY